MSLDPNAIRAAIVEIETAFAGLAPPGDEKLLHPRCMDDGDVAEFYGAPDRHALSDEMIIRNYAAPSFFGAEAFQYYMPAFMVWSLNHGDTIEYAPESTIRAFDPGTANDDLARFQISKFALFTKAQRRAVIRFLRTFSRHPLLGPIATEALTNYWARTEVDGEGPDQAEPEAR